MVATPRELIDIRAIDRLNRRYLALLEQEAERRYRLALCARLAADIRSDGVIDDSEASGRLAWNLARAVRRWERALLALDRPLPAGLLAAAASVTPPSSA